MPHGHWKTTTFTAGQTMRGLVAPMVIDGAMDGPAFRAYIENILMPQLPGDIVLMDNLPAHTTNCVREAMYMPA